MQNTQQKVSSKEKGGGGPRIYEVKKLRPRTTELLDSSNFVLSTSNVDHLSNCVYDEKLRTRQKREKRARVIHRVKFRVEGILFKEKHVSYSELITRK